MCVPGCQEAVRHALSRRGFFKGAAAAGVRRRGGGAADGGGRAGAPVHRDGRSHPRHVAGVSDLLRRAGHRDGEEIRPQEGRVQSLLVAHHRACRHASRCADPLLGERRHRRQDSGRYAGRAARRRRRGGQGGAESRLPAHARGSRRLGEEAPAAARQLLRGHAFRLGEACRRRRQVYRQGRRGRVSFPGRQIRRRPNG